MPLPHINDGARAELHAVLDDLLNRFNADPNRNIGSGHLQFGEDGEGVMLLSFDGHMTTYLLKAIDFRDKLREAMEASAVANAVGDES